MSIYDEIEKEQLQRALDSCASEEVRLREPITPTKEQIEHIAKVIFCTNSDKPISEMVYKGISDYWDRCLNKNTRIRYKAKAKIAITEWEKIRNSPN